MPITLPDGTAVFLDANIFVYHFSGPIPYTAPRGQLLQRIENGGLFGFTSTLVVAETLHRLMIIEAVATLQVEPKTAIRYLKANPKHVARLTQHLLVPDSIQAIGIELLSLEVDDIKASAGIKKDYGLLTNDAINLALMRRHRLTCIASNDSDFEHVTDLLVWKPA
jgi:predicted nucleic acid-binding protein